MYSSPLPAGKHHSEERGYRGVGRLLSAFRPRPLDIYGPWPVAPHRSVSMVTALPAFEVGRQEWTPRNQVFLS